MPQPPSGETRLIPRPLLTSAIVALIAAAVLATLPSAFAQISPGDAIDDAITTDEDTSVDIDVLDNDNGDNLEVTGVSEPDNGEAEINADSTITYTPDPDFNGEDTFTYILEDDDTGSDEATVTVTVEPVNDDPIAEDDGATTEESTAVDIDVLDNDEDVDGDPLAVSAVGGAADGSVADIGGGTITYTPDDGFTGEDTFTYDIEDGEGGTDTATVTVTVEAANTPPEAEDDDAEADVDETIVIDLLANDSDADGDDLEVTDISDPDDGSVADNEDGTVTYTPDDDFVGVDSFTYTIGDGEGGSDTATVTVTVGEENEPPEAENDEAATDEDTAVEIDVLANDEDEDGDDLEVTEVTEPDNGEVEINEGETVTYTPDDGFTGEDSFTYTIEDGEGGSDTATVTVTVGEDEEDVEEEGDSEKDECKDGGWRELGYRNQGLCIAFGANDGDTDGGPPWPLQEDWDNRDDPGAEHRPAHAGGPGGRD